MFSPFCLYFCRAFTHITGFLLRPKPPTGCILNYVAQCDPCGKLPPWLVNKVTNTLGPRMIKDLRKAALGYGAWKENQTHFRKPWRYPEEIIVPRILIEDCWEPQQQQQLEFTEASNIQSTPVKCKSQKSAAVDIVTTDMPHSNGGDSNVNFNAISNSNSASGSPVVTQKKTTKKKFKFKFDK